MGKWRFQKWRYHDPMGRELAAGSEVISTAEPLQQYRKRTIGKAELFAKKALAGAFREARTELPALIAIAHRLVGEIRAIPGRDAIEQHATKLADRWLAMIPTAAAHRAELERSLRNYIFCPKERRTRGGRDSAQAAQPPTRKVGATNG